MSDAASARSLADALESLATEVEALDFPAALGGETDRAARRDRIAWIIREYLVRRLRDPEGVLRVAIVGPTGSGVSTVLNSLAGVRISEVGPLRPTTTVPVVWCDPDLESAFAFDFLHGFGTGPEASRPIRIVAQRHPLVSRLALLDAPDFDSTEPGQREVAEMLSDASDACLLVVSRHRYADEAVWHFIEHLASRPTTLGVVMNRLEPGDAGAVEDFAKRLADAGFPGSIVGVIEEQPLVDGFLDEDPVSRVTAWLERLGAMEDEQPAAALTAVLGSVFRQLDELDQDRHADLAATRRLQDRVDEVVAARRHAAEPPSDEPAAVALEFVELRRSVRRVWEELGSRAELLGALAETEVEVDIASGDDLSGVFDAVVDEMGAVIRALVAEPTSIDDVERAAAVVMEAGRRFFDA